MGYVLTISGVVVLVVPAAPIVLVGLESVQVLYSDQCWLLVARR